MELTLNPTVVKPIDKEITVGNVDMGNNKNINSSNPTDLSGMTKSFTISNMMSHTNEEKALFHGLKSARRVAEDECHETAAEMAVLIGNYYLESEEEDD